MAAEDVRPWHPVVRARAALDALERLVVGMGTVLAVAASLWLFGTAVPCVAGACIPLVPAVADRERTRLEILRPASVPRELRAALASPRYGVNWAGSSATAASGCSPA